MRSLLPDFVSSKIFEGKVIISPPIDLAKAKKFAHRDAGKMVGWPKDEPVEIVSKNLRCVYLAHWIVSGEASGQWSALVGKEYKRSISGLANGYVKGKVIENYAKYDKDEESFYLLGQREFQAQKMPFDSNSRKVEVIKPATHTYDAGRKIAEKAIESDASSDGYDVARKATPEGSVDKYRLGYLSYRNVDFTTWLYPVYIGTYTYKDREYCVKIDGITGHTTIDKPATLINNLLGFGGEIIILGLFVAGIAGLVTDNSELCWGSLAVFLVIMGIGLAAEKYQEIAKSGKRRPY